MTNTPRKHVVIIGDIGWRELYHLGDEAMTEVAAEELGLRTDVELTLVAGHPHVASEMYGFNAVGRVGFLGKYGREENNKRLAAVGKVLAAKSFKEGTIYSAIRDCDAVVIAGGGNLNSDTYHLLYERLAATRIASHFGKPLFVTSQTVGPMITPDDLSKVKEIGDYALCFGARESYTYNLMSQALRDESKIYHTLDDAFLLEPDADAISRVDAMNLPPSFVAASFTNHSGEIWESSDDYYSDIAYYLDLLVREFDVDILLIPHAGSFDSRVKKRDQRGNESIASRTKTGRIHVLPMMMARDDVEIIKRSVFSLSTRYHPTVFATASAVPAIAISSTYYSSVRMRGSMGNLGVEKFVVPGSSLSLLRDACAEAVEERDNVVAHLERARDIVGRYQIEWWDCIARAIETGRWKGPEQTIPRVPTYRGRPEWSSINEALTPLFERVTMDTQSVKALRRRLTIAEERSEALEAELAVVKREQREAAAAEKARWSHRIRSLAVRTVRRSKKAFGKV